MSNLFILMGALLAAAVPSFAEAYVGPGAGLSAIGTVLAFVGVVVLLVLGFVWYPVKRLLKAARGSEAKAAKTPNDG